MNSAPAWLLTTMLFWPVVAPAHDTPPAHYHDHKVQQFTGLVCETEGQAGHIFDTWMERGAIKAREVYAGYYLDRACAILRFGTAYFERRIASARALNFNGVEQNVIVFRISPAGTPASESGGPKGSAVGYLVTWENINI